MKTVMVTGAGGFIGQHTVRALLGRGFNVVGVDWRHDPLMQVDPYAGGDRRLRWDGPPLPSGVAWYPRVVDIRQELALDTVFERSRPDAVIHLAAQSAVVTSWKDRLADARTNIIGTINVVEACRKYGVERIVYAGSGGTVYGDATIRRSRELTPIAPESPYGVSKMAGEFYVRLSGISHAVLRYPNVYGPGQPADGAAGVVAIFAGNMLLDKPCIIYGDGRNTRDYVFIDDIIAANIKALESQVDGVFNIGTGKGISVKEVHDAVAAAAGISPLVQYLPTRPGDIQHISLASDKAKTELGWSPEVTFTEGVARTVEALTRRGQADKSPVSWAGGAGSTPAAATEEKAHAV